MAVQNVQIGVPLKRLRLLFHNYLKRKQKAPHYCDRYCHYISRWFRDQITAFDRYDPETVAAAERQAHRAT